MRGVRLLRPLRAADAGAGARRHPRPLQLQLPAARGRHHAPALRARPQPLRAVLALRPGVRRDRGRLRLERVRPRHPVAPGERAEAAVGRGEDLHQLRQVRAGLPHRRHGREGLGRRGDDEAQGGGQPPHRRCAEAADGRRSRSAPAGSTAAPAATCRCSTSTRASWRCSRRPTSCSGRWSTRRSTPRARTSRVVEGAVSSQDDVKLAQTIRARSKVVVALGDCAVTSNVPSMRNGIPTRKLLERVYVEGATETPGIPTDGVPPLLKQAVPLHEVIKVDVHVPGCPPKPNAILFALSRAARGPQARPRLQAAVRIGRWLLARLDPARADADAHRPPLRTIAPASAGSRSRVRSGRRTRSQVNRAAAVRWETSDEQDHDPPRVAHRGSRQDHDPARRRGRGDRHAVPRHPDPRLREVHRGPALLRDAVDHGTHLRHLPGEPPARVGEGVRPDHGRAHSGGRLEAAGAAPLRAVRAVARAVVLPPLGARPAARHGLRPGQAQRRGPARGAPRRPARRHRSAQVRPAGDRTACQGTHPPLVDRSRRRQRPARPARPREDTRRAARRAGDRAPHARAVEEDARRLPRRDRDLLELPHHVRRPRRPGRLAPPLRRQPALRRPRRPGDRGPGPSRGLRDVHRRGVALRLVPQGAVLQAASATPTASTASVPSPGSTSPTAAAPRRPTGSSRSTASASAASSRAASTTTTRA